jgi:hypothetical protein
MLMASCVPRDELWGEDTAYAWSSDLHGVVINSIKAYFEWKWFFSPQH